MRGFWPCRTPIGVAVAFADDEAMEEEDACSVKEADIEGDRKRCAGRGSTNAKGGVAETTCLNQAHQSLIGDRVRVRGFGDVPSKIE